VIVTCFPVSGSKMVSVMAGPFRLDEPDRSAAVQLWPKGHFG
jgi:hypothetical protein